nr:hypothetical protein [Tanacetum cinerariifolium]
MAKLNQLAIDSKSKLLSKQVLLYVEREMERELRMTRILTNLCPEVTKTVRDKAKVIEEVKELGVYNAKVSTRSRLEILQTIRAKLSWKEDRLDILSRIVFGP